MIARDPSITHHFEPTVGVLWGELHWGHVRCIVTCNGKITITENQSEISIPISRDFQERNT